MKNDGQKFLEQLAASTPNTFDSQFLLVSNQLGLGGVFSRNELTLLYESASLAVRCYAAFNGLDESGPGVKPEHESRRHRFELAFLEARDMLYASPGWQNLPDPEQERIDQTFLRVFVADDKLEKG